MGRLEHSLRQLRTSDAYALCSSFVVLKLEPGMHSTGCLPPGRALGTVHSMLTGAHVPSARRKEEDPTSSLLH